VTGGVVALIALTCLTVANPALCQTPEAVTRSVTIPEIARIESERARRTDVQKKISSHLLDPILQQKRGAAVPGLPRLKTERLEATGGKTLVDIEADVDGAVLNAIRQAGGEIVNSFPADRAIRAYVPLERMESIAGNQRVISISPAAMPTTNAGPSDREGDIAHMADSAREMFHVDGTGIKVGILSDSIDDDKSVLETAFRDGAIKRDSLVVLPEQAGTGTGEGLAMAEIVHALAPGATIYFASGNGSAAQMAANIRALQEAGCTIIVDDLTYADESPFQDGPIARAVSQVTAKGVLYFSSAANSGSKKHDTSGTWEGDFADGGIAVGEVSGAGADRLHAFAPGVTVNRAIRGTQSPAARVGLFWADPLGASTNEYHMYVVDAEGHVLRTSGRAGARDPYEYVTGLSAGEGIVITKSAGSAPLFIHLDTARGRLTVNTDGNTRGHNASVAPNAFSVAAVEAARPPQPFGNGASSLDRSVESFSSDGPRRMFFNADGLPMTPGNFSSTGGRVFAKPDIAAADGVTTSFPSGDGLNPFHGTSAAAPHAAAIAALVLAYDNTLKPDQVRDILMRTALPIDGGGKQNFTAGRGIVMASAALQAACLQARRSCPVDAAAGPATSDARVTAPRPPTDLVRTPQTPTDVLKGSPEAARPPLSPTDVLRGGR
jgi:hypothetical protein